jgi:hypothetical protein
MTSGVRSRRAHRDLCCNLNLGHPSMTSVRLAASMWDAGAVAPCQCVSYFTHLKGEMTQPCVAAMATFVKSWWRE